MVDLLTNMKSSQQETMEYSAQPLPIAEFAEHASEVTQVSFASSNCLRAFSCSLDKQFKVYDIGAKLTLKSIQTQSPIFKMIVDSIEANVYLACENQNIYQYSMEISSSDQKSKQKKTLQHR